jgi:hypothetical protein
MVFKLIIAVLAFLVIMRVGIAILRAVATPVPEPPPPGELRKVNLRYRCSLCGAEVRMTVAAEQEPDPPRHCMEDMELVATPDL